VFTFKRFATADLLENELLQMKKAECIPAYAAFPIMSGIKLFSITIGLS
jgi:hypothetical protein